MSKPRDYDALKDILENWADQNHIKRPEVFAKNTVMMVREDLIEDTDDETVTESDSSDK